MERRSYSVSVPGSLVLLGEHSVLVNKQAVICAVDKRLRLKIIPDSSRRVKIQDTKLGVLEQSLDTVHVQAPFQYVLTAILAFKPKIKTGFTVSIDSEFSSVLGLGSSAAVTIAIVAALAEWTNKKAIKPTKIFAIAIKIMREVQLVGSGADLAASLYGGVVSYRSAPLKCTKLPNIPGLTAVYCGYKKPTIEVVELVRAACAKQPEIYKSLFDAMLVCVQQAIIAIKRGDMLSLGQIFMHHQGLQCALGVSNHLLNTMVSQLCEYPEIFGAKISGAGLGDCVIGLGTLRPNVFPVNAEQKKQGVLQIPVTITEQGLCYEN